MLVRIGYLAIGILILSFSPLQAQHGLADQQQSQVTPFSQTPKNNATTYSPSFGRLSIQYSSGMLFGTFGGIVGGLATIGIFVPDSDGPGGGFAARGYGTLGGYCQLYPRFGTWGVYCSKFW